MEDKTKNANPEPESFVPSNINVGDQIDDDNYVDDMANRLSESGDVDTEDLAQLAEMSDEDLEAMIDGEETGESETSESDEDDSDLLDGLSDEEIQALSELSDEELAELEEEVLKEEETDDDEIEDLLSNRAQKRIDKLTAQSKSKEEENQKLLDRIALLESKIEGKEAKGNEKVDEILSNDKITEAIQKGMDEGDMSVIVDAMTYIAEKTKKDTLAEQEKLQREAVAKQMAKQQEWNDIVKDYSPESYQYDSLKNDPDFNISQKDSKLFRLASTLFEKNGYANEAKGQSRAVREAYSILLERKLNEGPQQKPSPRRDETEGLKQRLGKEQRKNRVFAGANSGGESTPTQITESNELDDYIKSREKSKNEKLGVDI